MWGLGAVPLSDKEHCRRPTARQYSPSARRQNVPCSSTGRRMIAWAFLHFRAIGALHTVVARDDGFGLLNKRRSGATQSVTHVKAVSCSAGKQRRKST